MFSINDFDFSNVQQEIINDADVESTDLSSSNEEIDVASLPVDVVLGESYQEYLDIKHENEVQRQKNEDLKSTIKRVQQEIENRKTQLLDELKNEKEKLKLESNSLESELNALLGKDITVEEII